MSTPWVVGADRLEAYRNQHGESQELALDADGLTVTVNSAGVYERYGTTVLIPMDLLREMLAAYDNDSTAPDQGKVGGEP